MASLQELDAVQRASQELRMRITSGDAALQDAGSLFLNGLEQLQELRRLQTSVAASCHVLLCPPGSGKQPWRRGVRRRRHRWLLP